MVLLSDPKKGTKMLSNKKLWEPFEIVWFLRVILMFKEKLAIFWEEYLQINA